MMRRPTRLLLALGVLLPAMLFLAWAAEAQEPVTSRLKMSIGGYIKPEFMYSDTNQGGTQAQTLVIPPNGTVAGDNGHLTFSAQESRLNFTLTAPDWRGIKPTAFLEFDFFGAPSTVANPPSAMRMRHAFFRLTGEGLGGNWEALVGRTWSPVMLGILWSGSTVGFAMGGDLNDRTEQIRLTHRWKPFRDLTWETVVAMSDTSRGNLNDAAEVPKAVGWFRWIYGGWQGFQGGTRRPADIGFGAMVGRLKANLPNAAGAGVVSTAPGKSISNTTWGYTGGLFLPILPGRSATDRTWALSALAKAGYLEGVGNDHQAGWTPLGTSSTTCVANQWTGVSGALAAGCAPATTFNAGAPIGAGNLGGVTGSAVAFFKPMQANPNTGAPILTRTGTTGNFIFAPGGALGAGVDAWPELQLLKVAYWNAQGQLYLPWNFWIAAGAKAAHWTNSEDVSGASLTVKRMLNVHGTLFWDMTPNIRWGAEYMRVSTNYRNSLFDNASNRFHLAAYYFF